jgi:hypothetical protein
VVTVRETGAVCEAITGAVGADELLAAARAEQELLHRKRIGRHKPGVDQCGGFLPPAKNQWAGGGVAIHTEHSFL